ncbi:DUF2397 domain-containing protein [Actinokineospora spheciospongiae]|uniref:DUF2397 domain-containing protein n=1 Tax=Actinokineospora spheciospongiae TaxID=909613 RepID=UPI001F1D3D1D|nr:DUF2397 domain-containing protein [Actinokineospora spheciospongiae]
MVRPAAGQELVPAYLTSRFAAQYRVIVDVLLAEQDTSLTGLSCADATGTSSPREPPVCTSSGRWWTTPKMPRAT